MYDGMPRRSKGRKETEVHASDQSERDKHVDGKTSNQRGKARNRPPLSGYEGKQTKKWTNSKP
eukprot:scaffold800_cov327-Pavlova_lutheri.AAC.14